MTATGLDANGPAWRAARVAATLSGLVRTVLSPDEALGQLASCGEPPDGWLEVLAGVRRVRPGAVILLLPRPGDPRGLALPRELDSGGIVGWSGAAWLAATEGGWVALPGTSGALPPDPAEADRALREAIVAAAHVVDATGDARGQADREASSDRGAHERLIDAWVRSTPSLPADRRSLAVRGLRILLAIDDARDVVDVLALESAARTEIGRAHV